MHFAFNYYWNYWQMKLICNLRLLVSFIFKGSDKTNWKLSANNSQLRSKKAYLKYLSLGNLEAIFFIPNLQSQVIGWVQSFEIVLYFHFIVAFLTHFSKFLIALYVYQFFSYEYWAKNIFSKLSEFSNFVLTVFVWKFVEL